MIAAQATMDAIGRLKTGGWLLNADLVSSRQPRKSLQELQGEKPGADTKIESENTVFRNVKFFGRMRGILPLRLNLGIT